MTYDEQLQYAANLLIIQYRGKPRAQATIQSLAREAMRDNLPLTLRDAFNIDPTLGPIAVGAQLDIIGKYAGISRNVLTFSGGVVLNDTDYLTMIRLKLNLNNSVSTLKQIDDLLHMFLDDQIVVFDEGAMSLSYFFNSTLGSQTLAEAFIALDLLPRPTAVARAAVLYTNSIDNAFGWGTYQTSPFNTHGFNTYALHDDTPNSNRWLDYTSVITL